MIEKVDEIIINNDDTIDYAILLHKLVEEGNINELDRILDNDIDKNHKSSKINVVKNGMNLLHRSCHNGLIDISLLLINKYKMNINSTTTKGNTPLHTCLHNTYIWPHIELAVILISEYGADIIQRNDNNETAFECAHKLIDLNGI
jgi:ankyrin repeat protein